MARIKKRKNVFTSVTIAYRSYVRIIVV